MILMIIDNYSKFIEAFPLTRRTADVVAACIQEVRCRYGVWEILRVDNGAEFNNEKLRDLAVRYGFELYYGTVRNPQAQATVERANATIQGIVRALTFGSDAHWTTVLDKALDCYRSRPHASLNNRTPREVLLGCPEGPVPQDFNQDIYWAEAYDDIQTHEDQFPMVTEPTPVFVSDERVLVRVEQRRKLKNKYPWVYATVVRYLGRGSYLLVDDSGRTAAFNSRSLAKAGMSVPRLAPSAAERRSMADPNDDVTQTGFVTPVEESFEEPVLENTLFDDQLGEQSAAVSVPVPITTESPQPATINPEEPTLRRSARTVKKPSRYRS